MNMNVIGGLDLRFAWTAGYRDRGTWTSATYDGVLVGEAC
jgi:hypothetical protein